MKSAGKLFKCLIFCLLAALMVNRINSVLKIKGQEYGVYNPYAQYGGFYEMKKNTVDVLFLGSSHCYCGFSPQEFYNQYGIRSYNLGSSRQSIWNSYYWLREALKTQSPQVVVMDTYYVRLSSGDEPSIQKALSYMKWSRNKAAAVKTAVEEFPELDFKSFLLPNVRFHDRWKELAREDFVLSDLRWCKALKGHSPLSGHYDKTNYKMIGESEADFEAAEKAGIELQPETDDLTEWPEISTEYLEKIVNLCKERGIELILVKTPTVAWTVPHHNSVLKFAEEHDLPFYDFNTYKLYNEMQYDYVNDNMDVGHANVWGAEKLAGAVGKLLVDTYNVQAVSDEQWEETAPYTEKIKKEYAVKEITDAAEYLREIAKSDLTVLISVKGGVPEFENELLEAWEEAGLSGIGENSYAAVLNGEDSSNKAVSGSESAELKGTLHNGMVRYTVRSQTGKDSKNSIQIDGKEYAADREGVNIILYSSTTNQILDNVTFSAESEYKLER